MQQLSLFSAPEEKKPVETKQAGEAIAEATATGNTETIEEIIAEEIEQLTQEDTSVDINEELQTIAEETLNEDDATFESSLASNIFFERDELAELAEPYKPLSEQEMPSVSAPVKKVEQIKKRGRKSHKEMDAELDLVEVPEDDVLFKKQYYPISIVSKWFRVNSSLLRYWTQEFDILQPRTNKKGDRLFRPEDVKNLQLIYYLLRQRKFTIDGAKTFLKANPKSVDINMQLLQSLTKFRSFLLELKATLGA